MTIDFKWLAWDSNPVYKMEGADESTELHMVAPATLLAVFFYLLGVRQIAAPPPELL